MAGRRRLLVVPVVTVVLAAACTSGAADRAAPPPARTSTTATPATTTSTTVPVAADIADLISGTTMTAVARQEFLAAQPAIEDLATFTRNCMLDTTPDASSTQSRVHTQGCYVGGRIHLLAPDRPEAHDLLYVVAAHELLHAVYADLAPADRAQVDALVEAARVGNDRLEERLKPYGATPALDNEMHSILGSEFDGLSPALEAHYDQYFSNRATVVADRQRTLGTREDRMRQLKAAIDDLDTRIQTLEDAQQALRASGDIRGYNANVGVINDLIDQYDADVGTLNALIDEYNSLLGACPAASTGGFPLRP